MKDFIKRHSAWLNVAVLAIFIMLSVYGYQASVSSHIDKLVLSMEAGKANTETANKIDQLSAEKGTTVPLLVLLYVITGIMLSIPASGIVLYSYTEIPFLKLLIKGADKSDNTVSISDYEKGRLYTLIGDIFKGVCIIIGCGILLLIKL